MKKNSLLLVGIGLFISANALAKPPRISPLTVLESYTIPAVEISGMAWRNNPETKSKELIIVGDREHKIYLIDWETRKTKLSVREVDLKLLEKGNHSEQSEWESVFCDESGRVFIIKENPAQILVVSADLNKIETTIELTIPEGNPVEVAWNQDVNARGEGLLPLKNGHILVVKEKDPLRIIEFAPVGNAPAGYEASFSIERRGLFPMNQQKSISYVPSFTWRFDAELETLLEDSSGLNVDSKGDLYILGDQRNLIGRIGKTLKTKKDKIKLTHLWSIPSTLKQPEGMVIDDANQPIIAIDRKKKKKEPNLFLLSSME